MADSKIFPWNFQPGVKRDNTVFEGNYYTIGKWCRWYNKKPKKMGGYRSVYDQWANIIRGMTTGFSSGGFNYVFGGSQAALQTLLIDSTGAGGTFYDRTPAGFISSADNEWKMTSIYNSSGTEMVVIAMATETLNDISDTTDRDVYFGNITDSAALTALGSLQVSGGIVALPPYLFAYGNDGYLTWSDKNDIANIGPGGTGDSAEARICANKVVHGIPLRGGAANSPSGLFWSLDTLQRISFVGGTLIFSNDTIATDTSILSTNAVVDYDGVIFWPGVDRFLSFNGVVQEVPNNMSLDFFYNNYNRNFPQKIWAFKNPRYGEIWYCFPYGQSEECDWAVVQNVREGTWYDTPLPEGGRSAGLSPKSTFPYPLLFGTEANTNDQYNLWMHEYGVDKIIGGNSLAIESYFDTGDIAYMAEGPLEQGWSGINKWVRVKRIEPDFVLSGSLTFTLMGNKFAMAPDDPPESYTYDGTTTFKIDTRKQYRQLRVRVTSNEAGGDYFMGQPTIELAMGDVRAAAGAGV